MKRGNISRRNNRDKFFRIKKKGFQIERVYRVLIRRKKKFIYKYIIWKFENIKEKIR